MSPRIASPVAPPAFASDASPAARRRRSADLARMLGFDRCSVFVPAIMGVGLLFWLVGEVRDLFRSFGDSARDKRARLVGESVARSLPWPVTAPPPPSARGLRSRPVSALLSVVFLAGGVYVAIGSIANYARPGGYLGDIAWLLALALTVSLALIVLGVVAAATAFWWPQPPTWTERVLVGSMLTTRPVDPDARLERPTPALTVAFLAAAGSALALTLVVIRLPWFLVDFDRRVAGWVHAGGRSGWSPWSAVTDVVFGPIGVVSFAVVVVVAALRCRVLTAVYLGATALAMAIVALVSEVVDRVRPPGGPRAGANDSFPSGRMAQAVLIAVLFPVAVAVLGNRRTVSRLLRSVLSVLAALTAVGQVVDGTHWPTDVIGGAVYGTVLGIGAMWVVADQRAHVRCRSCPWEIPIAGAPAERRRTDLQHLVHHGRPAHPARHDHPHVPLGLIELSHQSSRLIAGFAHLVSFLVMIALAVVTFTGRLPRSGEGYVLGASVEQPVQYVLAGMVSVGALIGRRWVPQGAVLIAFAAACMGVVASIEYPPAYAVLFAALLMLPAFLLWLSWQHRRTAHELTLVAVVTVVLLGTTWVGARAVYDQYFGPTHPESSAPDLAVDEVRWVLAGRLRSDSITVSTRLVDPQQSARLEVRAVDGSHTVESDSTPADGFGVTKLRVDGLRPGTDYRYRVVVDGVPDTGRGRGEFRTPVDGPMSFDVVLASCARTGSNGAVFDAMAAEDALIYLQLGDAHYGNIDSTDPGAFLDAYDHMLTRPGQAAFYRSTPLAYIWDDHDYGPNDADASAPGREAAAQAYRSVVPSTELIDEVSVYQAFTIGRVRFVMTDTRSQKTATSMLGERQRAWLIEELTSSSRTHALVVWANSVPWIGAARAGGDGWAGYADERREIADAIAAAGIDNLVMVSGDAHMVALDDGTNTDYSSSGGAGFPLLQAAPLDRPNSVKGGPYSGGVYTNPGQYGTLHIDDDGGDEVSVTLAGHTWNRRTLVEQTFRFPVGAAVVVPG